MNKTLINKGLDRIIWLAARRDRGAGNGLPENPFHAADADKLDRVLRAASGIADIHYARGDYETRGYWNGLPANSGFQPFGKQRFFGHGSTVRIIDNDRESPEGSSVNPTNVFGTDYNRGLRDVCISDFILDCNTSGQPNPLASCAGVQIQGSGLRLERLRAMHAAAREKHIESFVLSLMAGHRHFGEEEDLVIEDCRVLDCAEGVGGVSAFSVFGLGAHGTIRNCIADGRGFRGQYFNGVTFSQMENIHCIGNRIIGDATAEFAPDLHTAFYSDTGNTPFLRIEGNTALDVQRGLHVAYGERDYNTFAGHIEYRDNFTELAANGNNACVWLEGYRHFPTPPEARLSGSRYAFGTAIIMGNTFMLRTPSDHGVSIQHCETVVLANNTFIVPRGALHPPWEITRYGRLIEHGNRIILTP